MASLGHIYVQDLSIRSVGEGLLIFLNARIDFRARAGYKICIFFQRVVPLGYYGRNLHLLPAFAKKWIQMAVSTKGYIEPRSILFRQCLESEVSQVWKSKSQQLISLQSGRLSYQQERTPFFIQYYLNFVTAAVRVGSFQKTTFWVKIAFCFFATKGHNKPAKNSSFFIFLWRQLLMLIKEKDFSSNVKVCEECV